MYVSPQLSVVGLSLVPAVVGVAIVYGRYTRKLVKRYNDALAGATQVAAERIAAVRTVRAFAAEDREEALFQARIDDILGVAKRDALMRSSFFGFTGLSGNAIILSILYASGYLVTSGTMSIGDLASFLLYAGYVGISMGGLSGFYSETMRGLGASTRLFELIDRRPAIELSRGDRPTQVKGNICFKDVHFRYPERPEAAVLSGLNLVVPAGSVLAVVGASGCGKSTLMSLLLRLYDPQQGSVELDGRPLTELDPRWLRSHMGTVSQEPVLFSSTIAENIAYAAQQPESVTTEQIQAAATEANAAEFVAVFPDGLQTLVGEKGVMLSGGQRQRIAIARALLAQPRVLLFDEATSALDSESEAEVKAALDRLLSQRSRTILLIAHRLSTVRNADQIAVLDGGRVAELGTFEELQAKPDGIFRRLVQKQTLSDQ